MVEQLTSKGWAQLGGSCRVLTVSASTNTFILRIVRLSRVSLGLPMSSIEALQVPSSIEHGWGCVNAIVPW